MAREDVDGPSSRRGGAFVSGEEVHLRVKTGPRNVDWVPAMVRPSICCRGPHTLSSTRPLGGETRRTRRFLNDMQGAFDVGNSRFLDAMYASSSASRLRLQ